MHTNNVLCFTAPSHTQPSHPTYSRSLITNKSAPTTKTIRIHINQDIKEKEAPIEQPRRLSLRRPSYKQVEVIQNESFINIQLKPVTKEKVSPQTAQQSESRLTKVNDGASSQCQQQTHAVYHSHTLSLFISLSLSLSVSLYFSVSLTHSLTHYQNRCLSFTFYQFFSCFLNFLYLSQNSLALRSNRYFNRLHHNSRQTIKTKKKTHLIWSYCLHFRTISNSISSIYLMYRLFPLLIVTISVQHFFLTDIYLLFVVN